MTDKKARQYGFPFSTYALGWQLADVCRQLLLWLIEPPGAHSSVIKCQLLKHRHGVRNY